jgi:hypothetical protein
MPLQPLQFRPGVNKEVTTLAGKGGWFDCDKVRFRAGYPEKIGGWAALSYSTFLGVARSLWNWVTLKGFNILGVGTNLKFYLEDGGAFYDITPIRATTVAGDVTFSAVTVAPFSSTITVTDTAHGCATGDFVTFSGVDASGLGGNITQAILEQEYQVTIIDADTYTIQARVVSPIGAPGAAVLSNASDSGNGGATVVGVYQVNTGSAIFTVGTGWGTGTWGRSTWGSGFSSGFGSQLRLWSQSNYGEQLLFSPRGDALFVWDPGSGSSPAYATRGTLISGVDVPSQINQIMVSDATRITICFGCNDYGTYNSTPLDPMLIRWSAQEDYQDWTPSATNQAGSYRLSHGSEIVGSLQTRQEILVWTDSSLYSMQYLGPPFVWGFNLLADNLSIMGPNAIATAVGITFWMGVDKFYIYAGRVETLSCSVWKYVFDDINITQSYQFFAGVNERFNEIWWFYCSADSNTIDRYVIYNYVDQAWYYGTLARTAWLDSPLREYPQATTTSNIIVFHEAAVDNGETNPPSPIASYIQSSDFDIGNGDKYGFVWRMIPDITFNGSMTQSSTFPQVDFKMRPRKNPGAPYKVSNAPTVTSTQNYVTEKTYNVQEFTELIYTRVRGRQMAFRIESDTLGTQWQLGIPKLDIRPDGGK